MNLPSAITQGSSLNQNLESLNHINHCGKNFKVVYVCAITASMLKENQSYGIRDDLSCPCPPCMVLRSKDEINATYRVGLAEGVLEGLSDGLVDEGDGRVAFLVLHPCAVLHVLDPVLKMHRPHQLHGQQIWGQIYYYDNNTHAGSLEAMPKRN